MKRLVVVGDSDIAFWPKDLLPSPSDDAGKGGIRAETEWDQPLVSGHSGATLAGLLPYLRRVLNELQIGVISDNDGGSNGDGENARTRTPSDDTLIVVACAGENDIGEGLSLEKSVEALQKFTDAIFLENQLGGKVVLIFLGPKFEPWLEHDPSYKKKYATMTRAFRRCLEEYETTTNFDKGHSRNKLKDHSIDLHSGGKDVDDDNGGRIHFIDCLTMFCGETANVPGARLGGRAKADPRFFASDELHLSNEGYMLWKELVEDTIQRCLTPSEQGSSNSGLSQTKKGRS